MAGKHFFTGKTEYTFTQIISTIAIFTAICFYFFNYFIVNNNFVVYNADEFNVKNTILNVCEYIYSVDFDTLISFEGEKTISQVLPKFDIREKDEIFIAIKDEKINLKRIVIVYKGINTEILKSQADI
ncbi:MAG: hypothetical protein M0R46_09185 [Candidatus Muirbacterium halophilum]|nr:hypothetical protein [Candidatus Muirbacterium halophilum]MCK9476080.1 hypothetical protein [Candidatus Muirbacterium halophilum]